ncbi:phage major capsid protein, partial [Rhodobacter lacus]
MTKLDDLRRDRKAAASALSAAAEAIEQIEAAGAGAEAPEHGAALAAFDAAKAAFDGLDAKVKRAETAEAALAAAAVGDEGAGAGGTLPRAAAQPQDPAQKGVEVGFVVHALARARGDRDKAAAYLEGEGHSGISAALSGASEAAGGVTIPRPMAEGLIELLRARVVVRAAGARTFPMPAGQIRHAKQLAAATATYQGENAAITPSEPSFDKMDQSFKKLTGLVPIGNSLLRHSGLAMAQMVRDDLLKVMALR